MHSPQRYVKLRAQVIYGKLAFLQADNMLVKEREMSKNTLTFELGGRIELKSLEAGVTAFRRLVSALTPSNERVAWVVEDLQPGSAVTTLRGEADNPAV